MDFEDLKKMGVVLKRAVYFITCKGRMFFPIKMEERTITQSLLAAQGKKKGPLDQAKGHRQLSLFADMGVELSS